MVSLELSPPVFSILSGLIEEKAGLHYGLLDRDVLREKASARALEAGFESLLDYYYFLRYDDSSGNELDGLVDTLVVNETYFFREWPAVRMLVDSILTPLCQQGLRPRVWSAACATGEEPLSLAMALDEKGLLDNVEILASDISARVLARARAGRFGRRSLRSVPEPGLVDRYLKTVDGPSNPSYLVPPRLISAIRWEQQNLLQPGGFEHLGTFDAILCRNVLIYFSDNTVKTILQRLSSTLNPQGALLVGVSESLLRYGSGFTGEERGGSFLYRKAGNP